MIGVLIQLAILISCWFLSSRETAYSFANLIFTTLAYCGAVIFEYFFLWARIQKELGILSEKRRTLGYAIDPHN
jgi:hypothetical protein